MGTQAHIQTVMRTPYALTYVSQPQMRISPSMGCAASLGKGVTLGPPEPPPEHPNKGPGAVRRQALEAGISEKRGNQRTRETTLEIVDGGVMCFAGCVPYVQWGGG
ncbi:hypothetical protein DQ04_08731030, partial [Trypanosoma grayi]|uniref:hypothetical protein n=1 Tax=Trypanosoma grayi TaxID=71804 RepID=UPI0004F42DE1